MKCTNQIEPGSFQAIFGRHISYAKSEHYLDFLSWRNLGMSSNPYKWKIRLIALFAGLNPQLNQTGRTGLQPAQFAKWTWFFNLYLT